MSALISVAFTGLLDRPPSNNNRPNSTPTTTTTNITSSSSSTSCSSSTAAAAAATTSADNPRKTITTMPEPKEPLTGERKREDIVRILNLLEDDLKKTNLLPPIRNQVIEELKVHTRSTDHAEPLFSKRGASILCKHSFDGNSPTTGRLAMRCLGNLMYFQASLRQEFVDLGYAAQAANRMKNDNREDELLCARLLFLCTYDTKLDFEVLFKQNGLVDTINSNLARHAKQFAKTNGKTDAPQANIMAVNETLKLLYNLTNYYPEQRTPLTKSLLSILKILANLRLPDPPLQQPVNSLVNAMIHLDLEDSKARIFPGPGANAGAGSNPLFPLFNTKFNVDRLCYVLRRAVASYSHAELDALASPLVQVLLRIAEFAPTAPKAHMRSLLLPSDAEREQALGKADTLPAALLRLSTSGNAPHMRRFVPALMFELSGKDAETFVRNVGYGFAAGFLLTHGMQVPESALEAWSTGATDHRRESDARKGGRRVEEIEDVEDDEDGVDEVDEIVRDRGIPAADGGRSRRERFEVNPITGQRLDREPPVAMPNMTDEEKQREAERLFVLFERLKATGVVNVENPVAKAVREGRFEELE